VLYGFIENHELISEARHWALILAARRQPEGAASVQAAIGEALA
jgi:hypothetical protein